MPNSLAWILDVLLLQLFLPVYGKQSLILLLIYLLVYFTSIFEENLRMLLIGFPTHYRLLFLLSVSEWVLSELL